MLCAYALRIDMQLERDNARWFALYREASSNVGGKYVCKQDIGRLITWGFSTRGRYVCTQHNEAVMSLSTYAYPRVFVVPGSDSCDLRYSICSRPCYTVSTEAPKLPPLSLCAPVLPGVMGEINSLRRQCDSLLADNAILTLRLADTPDSDTLSSDAAGDDPKEHDDDKD